MLFSERYFKSKRCWIRGTGNCISCRVTDCRRRLHWLWSWHRPRSESLRRVALNPALSASPRSGLPLGSPQPPKSILHGFVWTALKTHHINVLFTWSCLRCASSPHTPKFCNGKLQICVQMERIIRWTPIYPLHRFYNWLLLDLLYHISSLISRHLTVPYSLIHSK